MLEMVAAIFPEKNPAEIIPMEVLSKMYSLRFLKKLNRMNSFNHCVLLYIFSAALLLSSTKTTALGTY